MRSSAPLSVLVVSLSALLLFGCFAAVKPKPGGVLDEARQAGRAASSFPAADEDYFRDMDQTAHGPLALSPAEIQGRNMWLVWTGGDDALWNTIANSSVGSFDLLKTISSYPTLKGNRDNRWEYYGLVNEPCFDKAVGPDPARFGLWLDRRRGDCPPDPFENAAKYPGVQVGARGKTTPVGSYYGYATGIVGLRLFPNPDFDEQAARRWDPKRYYDDPSYYLRRDLVRPYRVGMSCGFCHVGPNPIKPPADPANPKWENLSSNVGAQYFWFDRIFAWQADPSSFVYQLFKTQHPGTLDTSLVSTDNINNPRTMNAVYGLLPRLVQARRWGKETLAGGGLNNRQFNDFVADGPLTQFFEKPDTVWTPRVLKDGSDSVGALGALNRVYLNIGLFSQEWLLHFRPLIGGKPTTKIEIAVARKNSAYWEATELQTPAMALFFLKSTEPHRLADAPGGRAYLTANARQLERGKVVFAETCARCHSSKLPTPAPGLDPGGCSGSGYLDCWNRYWKWTKTDEFKSRMREIVLAPDFLEGNFLSTEARIPVTLLETNACSPLATNAIEDNIWDNFSSRTYKDLPSVGSITVHHPLTGAPYEYRMPAGGRGYTRPASLISVWSTAPFLLNNSVGRFEANPSVEARMQSFQNSIEQLLWPERRPTDPVLGAKVPGYIARTTERSFLRVPLGYLPDTLRDLLPAERRLLPWLFSEGGIEIGPIPAGTPVNLLANLNLLPETSNHEEREQHYKTLVGLLLALKRDLKALPKDASDEEARRILADTVGDSKHGLLALNKCPDFVVNRGHYFGTDKSDGERGLSDDDKLALIEFLKTF